MPFSLSPGGRVSEGALALVALTAERTDALTVFQWIAALDADGKLFAVRDHAQAPPECYKWLAVA